MKRLLLSVFAAALTAAFVIPAPATASDITLSGQYRLRGEYRASPRFVTAADATTSIMLQRIRLTANANVTDDVSAKITVQDSSEFGANQHGTGGPALTDNNCSTGGVTDTGASTGGTSACNAISLHESYLNIKNVLGQPLDLRIGTQQLVYGDQRLIGAFGWNNNARSFDAIKATYGSEAFDVDFFLSKIDERTTGPLPNGPIANAGDNDQDFYGVYATVKTIPNSSLDIYLLMVRDGSNTQMASTTLHTVTPDGGQSLYTYGGRLKGNFQDLDYTAELALQSGTIPVNGTDLDLEGTAYAVKVGYKLPTSMKARVGFQYVYASGDSDGTDNTSETFTNLFPTNHGHMGYADQQAWRNVSAWAVEGSATLSDKLSLKAAYWSFKLAEKEDDWYHAGRWMKAETVGVRLASATGSTQDDVGAEIDIVATYKLNSAVKAQLGLSRFFSGDFLSAANNSQVTAGNEEDMDFAYLQIVGNF